MTAKVLYVIAFGMPLLVWLSGVSDLWAYVTRSTPPGQIAYIASKLLGLCAVSAVICQLVLAGASRWAWGLHVGRQQHALFGSAALLCAMLHGMLFILAGSLRQGKATLDLLVPDWPQGYFATGVLLGVIAFWLIALVLTAGLQLYARRHTGWLWLHRAVWLIAGLAIAHSLLIGTEVRALFAGYLCLAGAALLVRGAAALFSRLPGRAGGQISHVPD